MKIVCDKCGGVIAHVIGRTFIEAVRQGHKFSVTGKDFLAILSCPNTGKCDNKVAVTVEDGKILLDNIEIKEDQNDNPINGGTKTEEPGQPGKGEGGTKTEEGGGEGGEGQPAPAPATPEPASPAEPNGASGDDGDPSPSGGEGEPSPDGGSHNGDGDPSPQDPKPAGSGDGEPTPTRKYTRV